MIEIITQGTLTKENLDSMDETTLEQYIANDVIARTTQVMNKEIDNIADVDLKEDENGDVKYEVSLVLCSSQDMITKSQMQAKLMYNYGLTEEQTQEILDIQLDEFGGM